MRSVQSWCPDGRMTREGGGGGGGVNAVCKPHFARQTPSAIRLLVLELPGEVAIHFMLLLDTFRVVVVGLC